ncbi:hypothetical protein [uncultured Brevundimonas sp.]|jgi:hypothetical protein|uniref:hypothetical protein n=1 Tax=uncultured Brevundimonas sp. TaxID=213418 RepID=UPI0025D1EA73|nr:hypothetical protein [uncultured Brevundimonas sp.]
MEQSRYTPSIQPADAFDAMCRREAQTFGRRPVAKAVAQPQSDDSDRAQTWAVIALGGMIAALAGALAGSGLAL